jgi:hypothetical protein
MRSEAEGKEAEGKEAEDKEAEDEEAEGEEAEGEEAEGEQAVEKEAVEQETLSLSCHTSIEAPRQRSCPVSQIIQPTKLLVVEYSSISAEPEQIGQF